MEVPSLLLSILAMGNLLYPCRLCVQSSQDPLKEIKQITYAIFRGRSGGGARYTFYIELRNGKTIPFFFGKSKRNEELVEKLKRNAGRYGVKVVHLP